MNRTISGYIVQVIDRQTRAITMTCGINVLCEILYETHVAQIVKDEKIVGLIANLEDAKRWIEMNTAKEPLIAVYNRNDDVIVATWPLNMLSEVDYSTHYAWVLNPDGSFKHCVETSDQAEDFIMCAERKAAWKPKMKKSPTKPKEREWEKKGMSSPVIEIFSEVFFEGKERGLYVFDNERSLFSHVIASERSLLNIDYVHFFVVSYQPGQKPCEITSFEDATLWLEAYEATLTKLYDGKSEEDVSESPVDKIAKAVDPSHYKLYIDEMEWIDAMSKIPTLRKPERFIAALELQIRKYLDRNGGKDESLQELKKAQFYLAYLIAYVANGYQIIPSADIKAKLKLLEV